jgi:gliding motility-associated-like protein
MPQLPACLIRAVWKHTTVLLLLSLAWHKQAFSQKEAQNWYFGKKAGLDFSTSPPTPVINGQIDSREGVSSISDPQTGQLLFYSEGTTIWNRNHTVMPNGSGMQGDYSSTQSSIAIRDPANPNRYYFFTTALLKGMFYSVIDMTLNGGLGDVVTTRKNIPLIGSAQASEKLIAVRHCNGTDFWVVTHILFSNSFYVYLVNAAGVQAPLVIGIGSVINDPNNWEGTGYLKFSADGSKLAHAIGPAFSNALSKVEVLNFNNQTGVISAPVTVLAGLNSPYGIEFSARNKYLYVSELLGRRINQYDLGAANIDGSKIVVAGSATLGFGALQMGPDGKIYVAAENGYNIAYSYLGVINSPDLAGTACGFVQDGINLGTGGTIIGLPTFAANYLQKDTAIISFNQTCINTSGTFSFVNTNNIDSVHWDFGDGSPLSKLPSPSHTYAAPGTFNVSLILYKSCFRNDTIVKPVTLGSCAVVMPGFLAPDTVCVNTPLTITNTSVGATSYYWNFCSANVNTAPVGTNLGNPGNVLSAPVFMDYVFVNGNYYGFLINFNPGGLVRLDFGNSLLNAPIATNLGNFGGIIPPGPSAEGIQVVQNEGRWYAIIVGGNVTVGSTPRILKIDFGANITNPAPIATNWGNIGNMLQPVDLHIFNENSNWYGFTINAENNTITRFNFTNSFNNTPTAVSMGNLGNLSFPTGIYAINDNGFWRVFITNGGNITQATGPWSLTRLDFGSSLLNTPTAVNLGNPGGFLQHPRDITILKSCGQITGFVVNGLLNAPSIAKLDFNNNLAATPVISTLGNIGSLAFPHSISKLFRVNEDVYGFVTNVANNTITRLQFAGCNNASIPNSSAQNPPPISYNTPGIYNINLTIDDGLPTQSSLCKQVVVLPQPTGIKKNINLCTGDSIKIGTSIKPAGGYTWNSGETSDSIYVKAPGTYWVEASRYGCAGRDSFVVSAIAKPLVQLGVDTSICFIDSLILNAGNAGNTFLWQDGSANQLYTVRGNGKYYVTVTNASGCKSTDTIMVTKFSKLIGDFNFHQNVCDPYTIRFTGDNNSNAATYWSLGDGNTTTGNTALHTYSAYGNYTIKMSIRQNSCTDTLTKTIAINLVKDDIIITPDTVICLSSVKQLRTRPSLDFCWSPTTYLDNPLSPNPVTSTPRNMTYYFTASVPGNNIIVNGDFSNGNTGFTSDYTFAANNVTEGQYFVGTNPSAWNINLSNCTDHSTGNSNMMMVNGSSVTDANIWRQTINVTPNTNYAFSTWVQGLAALNPAQVQFSINGVLMGTTITPTLPACTWSRFYTLWNSGNNSTAVIAIVNKNTQASGNDFALDDISFSPILIKRDSVIIKVDSPFVKTNADTSLCEGGSVQLTSSGAATYAWTPAAGLSIATAGNPIATPASSTQYIVTGTTPAGCTAKDTINISIKLKPVITRTNDTTICHDKPVQLFASGGSSYSWTPAATLSNPAIANPIATPGTNTTYTVTVTGSNSCSATGTVNVAMKPLPVFSITPDKSVCEGSPVQLVASGGDIYQWKPASLLSDAGVRNPMAIVTSDTTFTVKIIENFCKDSVELKTRVVLLPSPAIVAQKSNDIDCSQLLAQLNASGGISYNWSPATGLNDPSVANPVATPSATSTYIVTGTAANGCVGKDSVTVVFTGKGQFSFNMPNAFTPNGDRRNDCFGAGRYAGGILEFQLYIFNRLGQKVFSTTNPAICWDGRVNGHMQDPGGFIYILKAKTQCGNVDKKGIVMLVR